MVSLKDKLRELEQKEVPIDTPTAKAKVEEVKGVKKELTKVKKGK